jgi:hypothetical protein
MGKSVACPMCKGLAGEVQSMSGNKVRNIGPCRDKTLGYTGYSSHRSCVAVYILAYKTNSVALSPQANYTD